MEYGAYAMNPLCYARYKRDTKLNLKDPPKSYTVNDTCHTNRVENLLL